MICNICEKESVCKLIDGSDVVKCAEFLSINPNDYIKDAGIRFKVIDSRTGKEPTERVLNNIAKKGGLIIPDMRILIMSVLILMIFTQMRNINLLRQKMR